VDATGHYAEAGDETCWSYAEQISQEYNIVLEFLGALSYQQLNVMCNFLSDLIEEGAFSNAPLGI
jgi:hypothetical protein